MSVNQIFIMPDKTMTFVCEDGLSHLDKYHVKKVYNFGKMKFENCDKQSKYVALVQAENDMHDLYKDKNMYKGGLFMKKLK